MAESSPQATRKPAEKVSHEVILYTYPKLIFSWLLIAMGYLLWLLAKLNLGWLDPEVLAWVYTFTLVITILTLGVDVNRNVTVFWMVLLGGCWVAILYLGQVMQVGIFARIHNFLSGLDPQYPPNLGLVVSVALSIPFAIMMVWTRLNSKWRITHNEFEHYQFGKQDDSLARGAKRVNSNYPDFFEFLLCMAGDLIIYDPTGRRELRRIPHVPMLPFVRKRISQILETTAVSHEDAVQDEADNQSETEGDTEHNV